MRRHPVICPECGAKQKFKNVRGEWFPCGQCDAYLRVGGNRSDYASVASGYIAFLVLIILKFTWWVDLLLWPPLTFLLAALIILISFFVKAAPVESDIPKGTYAGSLWLGLREGHKGVDTQR